MSTQTDDGGIDVHLSDTPQDAAGEGPDPSSKRGNYAAPSIDAEKWIRAVRAESLKDPVPPDLALPEDEPPGNDVYDPIISAADAPPKLRRLDDRMRKHLGTGLDPLFAVLVTAAGWPGGEDIPRVAPSALAAAVSSYAPTLPQSEIKSAITFLALDGTAIGANPEVWEQERRADRLQLRPLVRLQGGELLLPRHICRVVQELAAEFVGDGRLPWPDVPRAVADAANELRKIGGAALERQAADEVAAAGLAYRERLEPHEAAAAGLPGLPGEIDLLVCDQSTGTLLGD